MIVGSNPTAPNDKEELMRRFKNRGSFLMSKPADEAGRRSELWTEQKEGGAQLMY